MDEKCYFMTSLSLLKKNDDTITCNDEVEFLYEKDENIKYRGFLSNEAPLQYCIDTLAKEGKLFDKYIFLVTSECIGDPKNIYKGKKVNTADYIKEKLIEYIQIALRRDELLGFRLNEMGYNDIKSYVENCIKFEQIDLGEEIRLHEKSKWEFKDDIRNLDIYFDFTGGTRHVQVVSFLLLLAYKERGAVIKDIIYADYSSNPKIIRNINDTLDSYFELVTTVGVDKTNVAVEKIDSSYVGNREETEKFDNEIEDHKDSLKKTDTSKFEGKDFNDPLINAEKERQIQKVNKNNSKNPFQKCVREDINETIKSFNENIINCLVDTKVIVSEKINDRYLKNGVMICIDYYFGSKYVHGVIDVVQEVLDFLQENVYKNAVEYWKERCDISNTLYDEYYAEHKTKTNLRVVNERAYKDYCDVNSNNNLVFRNQIVFFNYGFPFACMDKGSYCHTDIRKHYIVKIEKLIEDIEEIRRTSSVEDYRKYLNEIRVNVKKRIPIHTNKKSFMINKSLFHDSEDEAQCFLRELVRRLDIVQPYRNDIAHNINKKTTEEKKSLVSEIKEWLNEYSERFCGEEL